MCNVELAEARAEAYAVDVAAREAATTKLLAEMERKDRVLQSVEQVREGNVAGREAGKRVWEGPQQEGRGCMELGEGLCMLQRMTEIMPACHTGGEVSALSGASPQ